MSEEERTIFVIQFSNFINNNFELIKSMYKLFKNGESNLLLGDKNVKLKSINFNKVTQPDDVLGTTLLLAYISMRQLEKPDATFVTCTEKELEEVINFSNWQKENNKKLVEMLEEE